MHRHGQLKKISPILLIESEEQKSLNILNKIHKPEGKTVGQISTILNSLANDLFNNPDETTGITKSFKKLQENGIRITDTSKTMNTELLMAIQLQNLILILEKILLE